MTTPTIHDLLGFFWREYSAITPAATQIQALLAERGETYVNDHVAFRTFNMDPIGVESLGRTFLECGYHVSGEYFFEEKKLRAVSYAPAVEGLPHVFISELLVEQFSADVQDIVTALVRQVPMELKNSAALFTSLPSWKPAAFAEYKRLQEESEYAAWLAAFGIRVNHFTVLINALGTFGSLQEFNAWLVEKGYSLNESGGAVKGSPAELLEQSSIMANRILWEFAGGERQVIPTCYHEFARRYVDPATGRLYEGFIAKSADKIFESTNDIIAAC